MDGTCIDKIEVRCSESKVLRREDSVMSQNYYTTLYKSWEASNRFRDFRFRFGGSLAHKYFNCCRVDDTHFLGIHVIFGVFLLCSGIHNVLCCEKDLIINLYLIIDGVLSVFLFPILLMNWKIRIGGCANEPEKVGDGTFWYFILILRIILSLLGTIMIIYLENTDSVQDRQDCKVGYFIAYSTVIIEWIFLTISIFIPTIFHGISYFVAPAYYKHDEYNIGSV